jgi:hypothetical protein
MATLTVSSGDYIRPHRGHTRILHALEGAAQTFKKGAPVKFSAVAGRENEIIVVAADPTTGIFGVAADDASGVQGTDITVWLAEPGVEFIGRVQDGGVLAHTNVGAALGLIFDAVNNIFRVDLSDTTNTNLIGVSLVDAAGDINGRISFQWKASARTPFQG